MDKSILSVLGALAGIRNNPERRGDRIGHRVSPALRLAGSFVLILLVSLSRSAWFLAMAGTLELVLVSLLSPRGIARVLRTSFVAALFAFVIFLPSAFWGNWPGVLVLAARVLMSVAAAAIVSTTMDWTSISKGLSSLRVPDLFILVLDLAIKYIALLGGLVLDMLHALRLRSVGRNRGKTESLGGVAGTVFLKSREAATEMYEAMECRGFSGSYRARAKRRPRAADLAFTAGAALVVAAFFCTQGVR